MKITPIIQELVRKKQWVLIYPEQEIMHLIYRILQDGLGKNKKIRKTF